MNRAYPAIASCFLGVLAAGTRGRPNLPLLTLASFKLARIVAHERIGACVREPLAEREGDFCRALRELTGCTRCCGVWAAVGLTALESAAPTYGSALTRVLAVSGANDWLQAGFARLTR